MTRSRRYWRRSTKVAVDLLRRFVYVANAGNNDVSAYSIGANGALTAVAGSPFAAGRTPQSVAVNLLGRFVYVGKREQQQRLGLQRRC
jgi:6-phosphogluconolactonase